MKAAGVGAANVGGAESKMRSPTDKNRKNSTGNYTGNVCNTRKRRWAVFRKRTFRRWREEPTQPKRLEKGGIGKKAEKNK